MPYLPVDLDGKRKAHAIERALGLPRHTVVGGLLDLWEGVWRDKTDIVDELALAAAFGPDLRIRDALVAREFIDPTEDKWRVRGASKWLFGMEGRSRGGHAAKSNLVPGARQKKAKGAEIQPRAETELLGSCPEPAETPSALVLGSFTQHPAPSTQNPFSLRETSAEPVQAALLEPAPLAPAPVKRAKPKAEPKAEPDPRHHPLKLRLQAAFKATRGAEYAFGGGKDARALSNLLAKPGADEAEIERRWIRGLQGQYHERCDTIFDLDRKWNTLTGNAQPESQEKKRRATTRC